MTDTPAEVVESVDPLGGRGGTGGAWPSCSSSCCCCSVCRGGRCCRRARHGRRPWSWSAPCCSSWRSPRCPVLMMLGHGRRHCDRAAAAGDALLGAVWVLFVWSVLGQVLRLALLVAGVDDPARSRVVAGGGRRGGGGAARVGPRRGDAGAAGQARRRHDPPARRGLDGLRVVLITDTHYGPIDRARWSAAVVARVNALDADVVCHTGDIADGTVDAAASRRARSATVRAALGPGLRHRQPRVLQRGPGLARPHGRARLGAAAQPAHRGRARRRQARGRRRRRRHRRVVRPGTGHGADLEAALAGADPDLPVLLLAHQPKQVAQAVRAGVDLQISGHTHGGQIWPFHFLVRLDQPVVAGPEPPRRRAPSSTPAAAPASGARRSGSSRPARSPC